MFRFRVPFLLLLVIVIALSVQALPPEGRGGNQTYKITDNTTFIDANLIMMFVTNHGNFGRDRAGVFGYDYGTWYPFTDTSAIRSNIGNAGDHSPLYAAGLWLGGTDSATGQTLVAMAEYDDEFVPGPMASGTYQSDRPEFKTYKLYKDSLGSTPNSDYLNWPVDQGAPVDVSGDPRMWGDQMLWCAFNDANASQHTNDAGETAPLGIEVDMTVWATHTANTAQDHLIYLQYKLYNKGTKTINDFYISHWFDPDLGYASDDLVGCDTLGNSYFCFNGTNTDAQYGTPPPAFGVKMLAGPVVPSPSDTAYWDGNRLPGYRNLGMSSFQIYLNGTDPYNPTQVMNYMRGLSRDGYPLPNGSKFAVPGNPLTGIGDLDTTPTDKRMMGTFGPVDAFRPGDSQCVVIVLAAAHGTNNINSIAATKADLNAAVLPLQSILKTTVVAEPIYQFATQAINPADIMINLGYDISGGEGRPFDPNSICVNGICALDSVRTAASYPGFTGNPSQLFIPVTDFLGFYGLLWDSASYAYTVTGNYTDGEPFSITGQVVLIGHRTGDLNSDGVVDVSDLIKMVEYFFDDAPAPDPIELADMNHDGTVGIGDLILLVEYMF